MWTRDPGIVEMIRHFDQEHRRDRWELVTPRELAGIQKEIERCRDDFSYAARNYFMITTKDGEDIPFRLWEPQEIVLDKWYWLRERYPDRAQKLLLLKARQLGCSTLIEGMIAWATIFFSNRNAIVVSHNDGHAAYLFGIMLHIYDMLPWWIRPMLASRKQNDGLFFANPDPDQRRQNPGNQSMVTVQSAMQNVGVGRGFRLNAAHLSEFASWDWGKFKDIVDGDMIHALNDRGNSFAFMESTGKGAGSPSEEMWNSQVDLAEEAEWTPLFIPWFFERTRFLPPEKGWRPQQPEVDMRDKVYKDWVRCDQVSCSRYYESQFRKVNRVGTTCPECHKGKLVPVILNDGQLRFMERQRRNAEKKGLESVKKLKEELSTTADEAWQLSGIQVFPPDCIQFANLCVDNNPMIWGAIDSKGQIHYVKDVESGACALAHCTADHRWDVEHPLQIWEMPDARCSYSMGVDVAEGLGGKADYSVLWINRVSLNGMNPDVQVAMWRSNTVDPIQLANPINYLGRMYNDALVSIEVNKYDSCFNTARLQYLYPNMFVWKHYDSKNPMSNKLGWMTTQRSKPMLWQTAVRWLRCRKWICKSDLFSQEMRRFQKDDYDDKRAEAERNYHDDVLMAGMIALFCSHDLDYSEDMDFIPVKTQTGLVQSGEWLNHCERCSHDWNSDERPGVNCPKCSCMLIRSQRNSRTKNLNEVDFGELTKPEEVDEEWSDKMEAELSAPWAN